MDPDALLESALGLHAYGVNVLPIRHRGKSGKQPAVNLWRRFQDHRQSEAEVRELFDQSDLHGIALLLGPVSGGIACIDFDRREDYELWAQTDPSAAATLPTVRTYRGVHVYFRTDAPNTNFAGGEIRTRDCYVLAPPSEHPKGGSYEWVADLPATLTDVPFIEDPSAKFLDPLLFVRGAPAREQIASVSPSLGLSVSDVAVNDPRIEEAIMATVPRRMLKRNRAVFQFARWLKAFPEFQELSAMTMKPYVQEWHRRALPYIQTKDFDTTWAEFLYGWDRVKYPKGRELDEILIAAEREAFPKCSESHDSLSTKRLIRFCKALSGRSSDGVFFLSCRKAGGLFDLDHNTAALRLNMLVMERILEITTAHTETRATRYRYIAD